VPGVDRRTRRKLNAGHKPDQIEHIGHHGGFIEVVDAPDQTPVRIAPGPEILQVQITDRKQLWRIHQLRTPVADFSGPAEIGGPQEDEGTLLHPFVFVGDILFNDVALRGEPGLVFLVVLAE